MVAYTPPDPSVGEMIYRDQKESQRQYDRLERLAAAELKTVLRDRAESQYARLNALLLLMRPRDPELPNLLLELFDDPDQHLWRTAIRSYRPSDPRVVAKLRSLLDDQQDRTWSVAACALARFQDETLLPRLANWLEDSEDGRYNVAVECLRVLDLPAARKLLEETWQKVNLRETRRLVLAIAFLSKGDERGLNFLESQALQAQGSWSVLAATSIFSCRRSRGLQLMMNILDHGSLEAKQSMVNQIWNYANLPHAFTADGLSEARLWVEQQMASSP